MMRKNDQNDAPFEAQNVGDQPSVVVSYTWYVNLANIGVFEFVVHLSLYVLLQMMLKMITVITRSTRSKMMASSTRITRSKVVPKSTKIL